jgi:NAD(P)-dependent dehydrogenase (short-subunit alcohol dehydrogenase family)
MNALIVGGSRGIGLAFARALLADASVTHVFAAARGAKSSGGLAELRDQYGDRLIAIELDITDEPGIERAGAEVRAITPTLNLLVNTAGLLHAEGLMPERRLADVKPDNVLRSYAVNALGPLLIAKHFQPLLAHGERAVLANLSARVGSISDNRLGGWYAYRASKAAQNQITRTLSIELTRRASNLICVALHPGTVETDLSAPFRGNVAAEKLFTPDQSAAYLLAVIAGLSRESNGRFYAWDGSEIPW